MPRVKLAAILEDHSSDVRAVLADVVRAAEQRGSLTDAGALQRDLVRKLESKLGTWVRVSGTRVESD